MADRHLRGAALAAVLLLLTGLLAACSPQGDGFVTREGRSLQVDGHRFRFVGFNLYDAAASDIYSCSPQTRLTDGELDDAMRYVRDAGGTVVRLWAYQTYTAGGTDYDGVDRALAAAKRAGLRVLPVLEDGPGDCSTGDAGVPLSEADGGAWFSSGYRSPYGDARLSFRAYAAKISRHYSDEPAIMGWSIMNEAETSERDSQGRSALVAFAGDMAAVLHRADPRHLVTLGTQGNGAPGASGPDFEAVYAQAGLDFTEVHDWGRYGSDTEAMPGAPGGRLPAPGDAACQDRAAPIACSFAIARAIGKPIVVGEAGIQATDPAQRARRARLLGAKMTAAFRAGASGYLVWQLNRTDTDELAVVPGSGDPLARTMRGESATLT